MRRQTGPNSSLIIRLFTYYNKLNIAPVRIMFSAQQNQIYCTKPNKNLFY